MGPAATVDFLSKVIATTQARSDQEHVPLLVHQVPQIPDRSKAILAGTDEPFTPIRAALTVLANSGAEFAVMPCNSAHHWYERLAAAVHIPLLHIADAVGDELAHIFPAARRIALMATRGTTLSGIYPRRLHDSPLIWRLPDEEAQRSIDQSILAVKAGEHRIARSAAVKGARSLLDGGAEVLVLACTELPLALQGTSEMSVCADSTLALAKLCVKESRRLSLNHAGFPGGSVL